MGKHEIVVVFFILIMLAVSGRPVKAQQRVGCVSPSMPQLSGIVGYWRGDGDALDSVGANNGTIQGNVTFEPGVVGQAFGFNGSSGSYVLVPDSATLNFPASASITILCWAYRASPSWPQHLVGKRAGCGGGSFYQLAIGSGAIPPETVPLNSWSLLAETVDAATGVGASWVNGVAVRVANGVSVGLNNAPLEIGNSGTCAGFSGLVEEVQIYDRALSESELQAIYIAGCSGGTCANPQPGDVNGDTKVDGLDMARFIQLLLGDQGSTAELCAADVAQDGVIDLNDIEPFVQLLLAIASPPSGARIGGWDASRGGGAAMIAGGDFANIRSDLATYFSGTTLFESASLTPTFLSSIDVLMISVVYSGSDVQIAPLSASEQSALYDFVINGGRVLLVTDNSSYNSASNSFVQPFGLHVANAFIGGLLDGTVTNHANFPEITDGPFGLVSVVHGGFVSYYDVIGSATTLATWNINSQPSLAALQFGGGRVVFFADSCLMDPGCVGPQNTTLRRNVLTYLIPLTP